MFEHTGECWGGHIDSVSCEEATAIRAEADQDLWYCPKSTARGQKAHNFQGGMQCTYGCGRYLQELIPDEDYGEDEL